MKKCKLLLVLFFLAVATSVSAQAIPRWKLSDLEKEISQSDKPTILNFWASFCKPCLEEIPYFQELVKKYESEGVRLILVNLDAPEAYPQKLPAIMKKFKITAPVAFLDESDADKFCPKVDPDWSGAIPASLFINNTTGHRRFFEDQLSREELEKQIQELVKGK